jgi:putative SOS response-associated peptidase YedK
MYWNLIPSGSPEFKPGKTWFNARAEKLSEPYQESLLKKKRCVFVASRFSEKRYEFRLRNDDVMFLGGLYDIWNEEKFSCTVITVPANETVLRAHDRMPYLVQRDHLARWLDPGNTNAVELRSGISPYPAEGMDGWREDNQTELF